MNKYCIKILLLSLLFITSCKDFLNQSDFKPTNFIGNNNRGTFLKNDANIGMGTVGNSSICRDIILDYEILTPDLFLEFGKSVITKYSQSSNYYYITIPVKNISEDYAYPFVKMQDIVFYDLSRKKNRF